MDQSASPHFAYAQLAKAVTAAKADQWRAVIDGMATGSLSIGSRAPVSGTPTWVTLEVAHGGFATGRLLAEHPDAARLNSAALTDEGLADLRQALRDRDYTIDLPEHAALMTVSWLLDHGHHADAVSVLDQLRPFFDRLRFTPTRTAEPVRAGVHLDTVHDVRTRLAVVTVPSRIAVEHARCGVWFPLYDRLVSLWCETVDGDLPRMHDGKATGGWPAQTWPADWARRRVDLLDACVAADAEHRGPGGNFADLRYLLTLCPEDSSALSPRDVGYLRHLLAGALTAHGVPGSPEHTALRAAQAQQLATPTHAEIAAVVSERLADHSDTGGILDLDPVLAPVGGRPVPDSLRRKVTRGLEAPVDVLVERGIIGSGEVLAAVLPQLTSRVIASAIPDPDLAELYARAYTAFRRRRGLLLLKLQHQVRLKELHWLAVLEQFRTGGTDARDVLRETVLLALSAFPQTILPNPLITELRALTEQAGLDIPFVEEVAADIFTGRFTTKWRAAADIASRVLDGALYARYYDLPATRAPERRRRVLWGKNTSPDFAQECRARALAAVSGSGSRVAQRGTVLEQAQILTTHNLAALVDALDLAEPLRSAGPDLAQRAFTWAVDHCGGTLRRVKNSAYAWRQGVFFLSFADLDAQKRVAEHVVSIVDGGRLAPAAAGLAAVVAGEPLSGRRFLGWSVGPHWAL